MSGFVYRVVVTTKTDVNIYERVTSWSWYGSNMFVLAMEGDEHVGFTIDAIKMWFASPAAPRKNPE